MSTGTGTGTGTWHERATCHSIVERKLMSQEEVYALFFPTRSSNSAASKSARTICNRFCPVREQCMGETVAMNDKFAIRAGTTANDRRKVRSAALKRQGAADARRYGEVEEYLTPA